MNSTIRLILADGHKSFRACLRKALEEEASIQVVGEAADGWTARSLAVQLQPDMVLMDLDLPLGNGIIATEAITHACPGVRVIILSMHEQGHWASQAVQAGAVGYLLKTYTATQLIAAMRTVANGEAVVDKAVAWRILNRDGRLAKGLDTHDTSVSLTKREAEILELLTLGLHNGQIADQFGCSMCTVRNHLSRIYSKMGVKDRTRAVVYALTRGLVHQTIMPAGASTRPRARLNGNRLVLGGPG